MKVDRVLMVDDDASIRKIGEVCLTRVGKWEVALAGSGLEALKIAADFEPDVILLDVMMPGMDGPTTLGRLQSNERLAHIPVVFMTAKVQSHEIETYENLGAAGVITKPFDPMKLPSQILKVLHDRKERSVLSSGICL